MDDNKLRQLERQYKLRVKTGCETCRARRVKCDETKPECQRCTKTGRRCEGYKHASKSRDNSPAAAASFRNPAFLMLPQKSTAPTSPSIPRNPISGLSFEAAENRSFLYFQTHTLPKWTEFFESELWSQRVLQLSHHVPAIRHGILALSTLHERFESATPIFTADDNDFAFRQYARAVKHSNELLKAHQRGKVDIENVLILLIACIIFTCYENLAGNYRAANMHLRNGMRILGQHRTKKPERHQITAAQESIENVLFRFDLQAMTFSDNTSPYEYSLDNPPECPQVPLVYTQNDHARNNLVGLLRCMMWISGIANINPRAISHPAWVQTYTQLIGGFDAWGQAFEHYQNNIPTHEQGDAKIYAGNTLLKIYSIMARIVIASGAGERTEMAWDLFVDSFQTVVDLAETLPMLAAKPISRASSQSSASQVCVESPDPSETSSVKHRLIAPNPASSPPAISSAASTSPHTYFSSPSPPTKPSPPTASEYTTTPNPKAQPTSFSPSFELSPIVPLFITACRCREPALRRRAIAMLLNCRRREGVWDSFGAGMVAVNTTKLEEGLSDTVELGPDNWLPLGSKVTKCSAVPEEKRVGEIFVSVNMNERQIGCNYMMRNGDCFDRYVKF